MVVSSACMMVALMAHTVTSVRRDFDVGAPAAMTRLPGDCPGGLHGCRVVSLLGHAGEAEQGGERAAATGVDRHVGAHAGAQVAHVLVCIDGDAHRNAL